MQVTHELMDEHQLILKYLDLMERYIEFSQTNRSENLLLDKAQDFISFIQRFADSYHHAKEEDILFKYFDENSEILQVMYEDHTTGRGHVKAMLEALERNDQTTLGEHLMAYRELLTEHIKKEDEILFPWMDRNLSTSQVDELFSKFNDVDQQMGFSPEKYEVFVQKLEIKFY
jgi:hemerythrin-like domain-containing protein